MGVINGDSAGLLAAASKLGAQQGSSALGSALASTDVNLKQPPAPGLASTSSLAQLSSLLQSSSSNRLGSTPNLSSNLLNSKHSFDSLFGSLGNLRNDTFSNLLKSSNSLKQLSANADWGLNRSDSSAILRRHLQNVAAGTGQAGGSGNANATFDFGNNVNPPIAQAHDVSVQARNLLLGLAGAGGSGGSLQNTIAARISNSSIDGMKNAVRFQDQSPNTLPHQVAAAASLTQSQDNTIKQQMLQKLGTMLQNASAAGGGSSNHKSQYDALQDILTKKCDTSSPSQSASTAPTSQSSAHPPSGPASKQTDTIGNTYKGLFSWLENDSMFLSEDKLKEQDAIHAKKERESQQAPMPLRFFSSGEEGNLEMMGQSLFGGKKRKGGSQGGCHKKKQC